MKKAFHTRKDQIFKRNLRKGGRYIHIGYDSWLNIYINTPFSCPFAPSLSSGYETEPQIWPRDFGRCSWNQVDGRGESCHEPHRLPPESGPRTGQWSSPELAGAGPKTFAIALRYSWCSCQWLTLVSEVIKNDELPTPSTHHLFSNFKCFSIKYLPFFSTTLEANANWKYSKWSSLLPLDSFESRLSHLSARWSLTASGMASMSLDDLSSRTSPWAI